MYVDAPKLNPYTKKVLIFNCLINSYDFFAGQLFRSPIIYSGNAEMRSVESFVSKSLGNIPKLKSLHDFNEIQRNSSTSTLVLLYSEKDTVSMHYKSIAFSFRNRSVAFAQVHKSSQELVELHNVTSFPTLGVLSDGTWLVFEGDVKDRQQIKSWLEPLIPADTQESKDSNAEHHASLNFNDTYSATVRTFTSNILSRTNYAWVVLVVDDPQLDLPQEASDANKRCEGALRLATLSCFGDHSKMTDEEEIATMLCAADSPQQRPFFFVVPYGAGGRKKVSHLTTTCLSLLLLAFVAHVAGWIDKQMEL